MKRLLALVLALLMMSMSFACAEITIINEPETEETTTEEGTEETANDIGALIERAAGLDLSSLTSSVDIASLASDFLGFAVNNGASEGGFGNIGETITQAISSLSGDGLANLKTVFVEKIIPAVTGLLSGDNSILSALSEAKDSVTGLLGDGAGSVLDAVGGLLGGSGEAAEGTEAATEEGSGFNVSSLLSMIGVNTDMDLSLEGITDIWNTLKDTILSALQK